VSREKPKLAVWKFASFDGCQLSLLECEDELLALVERLQIAYFLEASRATVEGPYDLSLVEGSITTEEDRERIRQVRALSKKLVTIGACATSGGIQALRNFGQVEELARAVYPHPEYLKVLETSTAISDHVPVDFELRGCPINKHQLVEVILAMLSDRRPRVRDHSVCMECKQRGTVCLLVAERTPCLGPATHAGCGAICPAYGRGCYGCYGPTTAHASARLAANLAQRGASSSELQRLHSTFHVADERLIPIHRLGKAQPGSTR